MKLIQLIKLIIIMKKKNERPKSLNKINNNYKLEGDIIKKEIKNLIQLKTKIQK